MKSKRPSYEEIAPRLRELRDSLGLSQEELAAKAQVHLDELVLYETGTVEIPVSFLFKIARACRIDTTALISGGEAHLHGFSLVRKNEGLAVERRKDYRYRSLAYRFAGRHMEPFIVVAPPKEESELKFHSHEGQEFIYILSGRLELRLGEETLVLEPEDSLYFDSQLPHALRGLDGGEAEFLDVII